MISPLSIYSISGKNWLPTFSFILLSILLGIVCLSVLPSFPVVSDSLDYKNIAIHIIETGEYTAISSDNLIYPPLYPIYLAIVYSIFGASEKAVYFIQFLMLGIIAATYVTILHRLKVNRLLSIIGGLVVLFWPYMILYSLLVASEMLYMFFLSFAILFMIKCLGNGHKLNVIAFGIFMALAVMTRPVALLIPFWMLIGALILSWIKYTKFPKEIFTRWLLGTLIFIAVLLPWTGYVYFKFGKIIPVASNLSFVFQKANKTMEYMGESTSETQSSNSIISAKIKNIYLFWNPGADGYNVDILKNKLGMSTLLYSYKIGFFFTILLGLVALVWSRKKLEITALLMIVLYFWALHTVLFPFPRYTLPIMPIMIILAVYSINNLYGTFKQKNTSINTSQKRS